jgi:hypothetical protein
LQCKILRSAGRDIDQQEFRVNYNDQICTQLLKLSKIFRKVALEYV